MGCGRLEEDTPIVNGPYPIGEREEEGQRREERGRGGRGRGGRGRGKARVERGQIYIIRTSRTER